MRKYLHFVSLILLCCVNADINSESIQDNPIVRLRLGTIRGNTMTTRLGKTIYAFRGIPYAKPPVGPLRFKPPMNIEPWHGVFNATKDGSICPQVVENASVSMSEDCLIINVYTRWLPTNDKTHHSHYTLSLKPVIVYIHAGGFFHGSSDSYNGAGPQYMMDRDIVLVTFNYRLGALGFLSTGTCDSPGNYGLMDQVLAFRWVQDHIQHFGGNPNSVTMFGYSSGAMSATLHMVSQMSKGLFHQVIAMSGSEVAQFDVPYNQLDLAIRQANLFNCSTNTTSEMVDCLRTVDANELGASIIQFLGFASVCPPLIFLPVVEDGCCQIPFLVEQPRKLFQLGQFAKVHIIAGVTEFEFLNNAKTILQSNETRQNFDADFIDLAPVCAWYPQRTMQSIKASKDFRKTLPYHLKNDNDTLNALQKILSDGIIAFPTHRFIQLACQHTTVYYYETTFLNRFSLSGNPPYGTVHGDDLYCLIANPSVAPLIGRNDSDGINVEHMTRLWSGFAYRGTPNQPKDKYLKNLNWIPTTEPKFKYLEIGASLIMKENLHEDRYALWNHEFPLKHERNEH